MADEYFKIFFDSQGNLRDPTNQAQIIQALVNSSVTDLWVFAHGWNNDLASATGTYDSWCTKMREVQQKKIDDPAYHPAFVGVYWPSKAWADSLMVPAATAPAGGVETSFLEDFRALMDPEDTFGNDHERDFTRLHRLMSQAQPTQQEIREFIKILRKYRTSDPHSDPLERRNITNASLRIVSRRVGATPAPLPESFAVLEGLTGLFSVFSFWTIKARSAVVGENGVYRFLKEVRRAFRARERSLRIHLFGHSFGAKLVSAAVYAEARLRRRETPFVHTLVLLLGAFSQFSFSSNIPVARGAAGRYAAVAQPGVVANPLLVIYSQFDTANRDLYPLGMRFAIGGDTFSVPPIDATLTAVVSTDPFGALGANGAQALGARQRSIEMLKSEESYSFGDLSGITCLNVDGKGFINEEKFAIGAHNDTNDPEVFSVALELARR